MRLSTLYWRSSDVARYQGALTRAISLLIASACFRLMQLLHRRPQIVFVREHGRLVGGFMLSPRNNFHTVAIDKAHPARRDCFNLLARAFESIIQASPETAFTLTTLHPRILREGLRVGFRHTSRTRYIRTAQLGSFHCSWRTRHAALQRPRLRSTQIFHMLRPSD